MADDVQSPLVGPPHGPRMGIVVPLANEESTIGHFIKRLLVCMGPDDRVFTIFDPICTDSTMDKVRAFSEEDSRVIVIFDPESCSPVDAYFSGYRAALAAKCQWILEMDAGLSHRPEEMPRFIEAMEAGADFAPGSRFSEGGRYNGQFRRYLLSKGGTLMANSLLRSGMRDLTSGYKCHTHKALSYVVEQGVNSRAHSFQIEVRWMLRDWNVQEVPISYNSPSHQVGATIIADCLKNLWKLFLDSTHKNPRRRRVPGPAPARRFDGVAKAEGQASAGRTETGAGNDAHRAPRPSTNGSGGAKPQDEIR